MMPSSAMQALTASLAALGLQPANFAPLPFLMNTSVITTSIGAASETGGSFFSGLPGLELIATDNPTRVSTGSDHDDSCVLTTPIYHTKTPSMAVLPPFDHDLAMIYRHRQQRSVNLGGWFVHESWMTPSLFRCATGEKRAELDIATGWGGIRQARSVLERHWDTFITKKDFAYLQSVGINTVRLPIGYWMLGPEFCAGTAFEHVSGAYINAWSQITNAVNLAAQYGIGVLIDLHGAPGSQNGKASSGISDGTSLMDNAATKNVLIFLAERLVQISNVIGIGLLNEPVPSAALDEFYDDMLDALRDLCPLSSEFPFYIQDGYDIHSASQYIQGRTDWLILDHHSYFTYDGESPDSEATGASTPGAIQAVPLTEVQDASEMLHNNVIIGEFSCVIGKSSLSPYANPAMAQKRLCAQQLETYTQTTNGYHFWSYIGESCDKGNWCFKKDVGNTLPQNFLVYNGQPINQETATADLRTLIAKLVSPDMTKKTVVGTVVPPPGSIRQRRIESRSLRRRQGPQLSINHNSTDSSRLSPSSGMPVSNDTVPHSLLVIDSYADGFEVAKKFALEGFSQLGFVDQYLSRRLMLIKSGSIITQMGNQTLSDDDDASDYSVWFLRGLKDGQNMITKTIQAGPGNKIVRRRATGSKLNITNHPIPSKV